MFGTPPLRLISKPIEALIAQSRPASGLPEVTPWYFFHRRTYTSGTTIRLNFFDQTETDPGLSNMELAGQLPTPQFFEIYSFHFDVLTQVTTSAGIAGAIQDNLLLRRSGRGRWKFTLAGKDYGEFPLTGIGPIGNATGFLSLAGAASATDIQYAGWAALFAAQDPILTIPPTTGFKATVQWQTAQTLTGDVVVEFGMWGVLHRKVV
jgi:hypothetical protein